MTTIFTANRVTAIATWLAGLGGLISAGIGIFPNAWQNTALAVGSLLVKGAVAIKFLDGSQKSEALKPATVPLSVSVVGNASASQPLAFTALTSSAEPAASTPPASDEILAALKAEDPSEQPAEDPPPAPPAPPAPAPAAPQP